MKLKNIFARLKIKVVSDIAQEGNLNQLHLEVVGLPCGFWANRTKKALEGLSGVIEAKVDADNQKVQVIYQKEKINHQKIVDQIKELGLKGDAKLVARTIRHLFHWRG